MEQRAATTVIALTGESEGARVPTLYLLMNIWRRGIRSVMSWRRGSQVKSWQKDAHMDHVVLLEPVREGEILYVAAVLIRLSSLRRLWVPGGSQAAKVAVWETVH
jgi:hypothetical protein